MYIELAISHGYLNIVDPIRPRNTTKALHHVLYGLRTEERFHQLFFAWAPKRAFFVGERCGKGTKHDWNLGKNHGLWVVMISSWENPMLLLCLNALNEKIYGKCAGNRLESAYYAGIVEFPVQPLITRGHGEHEPQCYVLYLVQWSSSHVMNQWFKPPTSNVLNFHDKIQPHPSEISIRLKGSSKPYQTKCR